MVNEKNRSGTNGKEKKREKIVKKTDRNSDRQTGRQTDRQTDRHKRHKNKCSSKERIVGGQ